MPPIKYILKIFFLLFSLSNILSAQEEVSISEKYTLYRKRFDERFIRVGDFPGGSLPCGYLWELCRMNEHPDWETWIYQKGYGCEQPRDTRKNGGGMLDFGDGTIKLGRYIAMLATEYEVLRRDKRDFSKTVKELYFALKAYYRLEAKAAEFFNVKEYPGFFVRSDAPPNFWEKFQDLPPHRLSPEGNAYTQEVSCVMGACACAKDNKLSVKNGDFTSQDQVINLLLGMAFIKRYVDSSVVYEHHSILEMAQDIAFRMINRLRTDNWKVTDPLGEHPPNRWGGNALYYAYGLEKSGEYIYGQKKDKKKRFKKAYLKSIYGTVSGAGNFNSDNLTMFSTLYAISDVKSAGAGVAKAMTKFDNQLLQVYHQLLQKEPFNPQKKRDAALADFIEKRLREAPISGPCNDSRPDKERIPSFWWYYCPNTPGWQDGENYVSASDDGYLNEKGRNGEYNGVNYMLMYNCYMLWKENL